MSYPRNRIAYAQAGYCAGSLLYYCFLLVAFCFPFAYSAPGCRFADLNFFMPFWYRVVAHAHLNHGMQVACLYASALAGAAACAGLSRPIRHAPPRGVFVIGWWIAFLAIAG